MRKNLSDRFTQVVTSMSSEESSRFASESVDFCGLGYFTCSSSDRSQTPLSDLDDNAMMQEDGIIREFFFNAIGTVNGSDSAPSISPSRSFDVEGNKLDDIPHFIVLRHDGENLAECELREDLVEHHLPSLHRMSLDEIKNYERYLTKDLIITQSKEITTLQKLIERELILWRNELARLKDRDEEELPPSPR
jgi:hypothetical protein